MCRARIERRTPVRPGNATGGDFLQFEIEVHSNANALYTQPAVVRPSPTGDHLTTMLVPELEEFARVVQLLWGGTRGLGRASLKARRTVVPR
jgi:hypothetical protein